MAQRKTAFVYDPSLAAREYNPHHPFKPVRSRLTFEMCRRRGYLARDSILLAEPARADRNDLLLLHADRYLTVLEAASRGEIDERILAYGLGTDDCPVFPGLYDFCRETVGATLHGLRLLLDDDRDLAFVPAGGMHHALPDQATGFCYVNDVAIACRVAADRGLRVAYLDVDAHHGNGVEHAFWEDDRVLVVSIHETGRTLYPGGGFVTDQGAGRGLGYTVNIPLEPGADDTTMLWAFRQAALPAIQAFQPDLLVMELGADALATDPLTHLRCTNNGLADVTGTAIRLAPRVLVTGGGGYDVPATVKAWTLCWSVMNDLEPVADPYAMMGGVFLGEEQLLDGSLRDMNIYMSGPERERVRKAAEEVVETLRTTALPILSAAATARRAPGARG